MFGHHFEARFVRNNRNDKTEKTTTLMDLSKDDIKDISKTVAKHATTGVVAIMTAAAVLHTVSEVIINTTNPANKND